MGKVSRIIIVGTLLLCVCFNAQTQERTRRGFYLSSSMGPVFGVINGSDNQGHYLKIEGTGFEFDAQIGGAVKENLLIHGTLGVKAIFNPTINSTKVSDISISESILGVGV